MADLTVTNYDFTAVLQPYMPVFYVSFLATVVLTPLMRVLAHRHGIVDDPDGKRKVHTQPIAYLGGVSIFLGWLAGVCIAVFLRPHNADATFLNNVLVPPGVLLGAATVVLFGLLDDVYSLNPKAKLVGQFMAAVMLVVPGALGSIAGLDNNDFFLGVHGQTGAAWMILSPLMRLGVLPLHLMSSPYVMVGATILSFLAAVFIIIAACNATNLLDGLDGLCSGVTGVMSIGYLILAVYLATSSIAVSATIDPTRITLSLALLGAVMGFLPYNFNPASIFMGDTGSMFLGFICGTMILLFGQNGTIRWFLSAIIMFGLPMMDTLLAIVRRKLNGKPIFSPDSNHFHHFLVKRGFSVRKAVLLSYLVAAVFVSFALIIVVMPNTRVALGIYLVLFAWIVVIAFKMGMIFQQVPAASNTQLNMTVLGTANTPSTTTTSTAQSLQVDPKSHPKPAA
ncbi:MAG TPA: MraY family glycosyltransferase [Phycisphaerae bacterium]|nr:MraY family glycosyltransferase [Phycisphaerae bacterium]